MTMVAVGALIACPRTIPAQFADSEIRSKPRRDTGTTFTLRQFIETVVASNLELAAQRYNVSISQAQLVAARVSPNPILTFGGARTQKDQSNSENAGVSQLVEIGGKRHFRVSVATKNLLAVSATLGDFLRTLRGTAANAFIDAVASDLILQQKRKAFDSLNQLSDLNRIRLKAGDIADVDYN
ncbi:MAG: TolC family protein, partial [Verrucomicrobiota bacterium]|nr:TolC family protein [Verrucomicrobiota bacterium]